MNFLSAHRRVLMLVAGLTMGLWAGVVFVLARTTPDPSNTVDAIVVLGCRVLPDGQPSVALAKRARKGAQRYKLGVAPKIVFTGGVGTHGNSEASAAADVARTLGVPDDAIVLEEASTSTVENARFVAAAHQFESIEIVTDGYHAYRATKVFEREFSEVQTSTVGTHFPYVIWSASREILAIMFYKVAGRI